MPTRAAEEARKARKQAVIDRAKREGKSPYLTVASGKARELRPGRRPDPDKKKKAAKKAKAKASRIKRCGDFDGWTSAGARCRQPAGQGTDHIGTGRCYRHGGANPQKPPSRAVKKGNRRMPTDVGHEKVDKSPPKTLNDAKRLLGIPIEMDPFDALMWCIRITAGEIQWYSDRMAELKEHEWIEDTFVGKQLHMYARNRTVAIDRLAKYSKWAVDSGIAERAMRLAESYGEQLYVLLHGVLEDLELTPTQRMNAPEIITRHLMAMEKKNVAHSPNVLVSGADPDTIVIEDAEVVEA